MAAPAMADRRSGRGDLQIACANLRDGHGIATAMSEYVNNSARSHNPHYRLEPSNPSATSITEMHRFIARYGDARLKANADAIMSKRLPMVGPGKSIAGCDRIDDY
jgi:hypothetical protein